MRFFNPKGKKLKIGDFSGIWLTRLAQPDLSNKKVTPTQPGSKNLTLTHH